jgi:hypothetical protein
MCDEYNQLNDGMEIDSDPLTTPQTPAIPESKGSEAIPPYIKTMMKKLKPMSYAIQKQTS